MYDKDEEGGLTKRGRKTRSEAEGLAELGGVEAVDAEELVVRGFAAEEGDGAAREAEAGGEEIADGGVGAAVNGWRVDFDFQRIAEPAGDLGARGVRDDFDGERAGNRHGDHFLTTD